MTTRQISTQEAFVQAEAILALEGDAPDEFSRKLRDALARGEVTPEQYRAAIIRRAELEDAKAAGTP